MSRTTSEQDREFEVALLENMNVDASFAVDWVGDNFMPEEVFDICFLEEWAEDNGYIKA